jgi:hypothetical protein
MKPSDKEIDMILAKPYGLFHDFYDARVGATGNKDKTLSGFQDERLLFYGPSKLTRCMDTRVDHHGSSYIFSLGA